MYSNMSHQNNRTYCTADTHLPHDIAKLKPHLFEEQGLMTKEDYLIINGDCGLIFDHDRTGQSVPACPEDKCWSREEIFWLEWFEERPFTTLFLDGNHENFDRLEKYPIEDWHGGKVQMISDSVIHLMRGEIYTLCDNTFFVFGGAESTDRGPATNTEERDIHKIWWPQEIPSSEERDRALQKLAAQHYKVDFIMTHDAPSSVLPRGKSPTIVSDFLETIRQRTDFRHWFCGHHHIDKTVDNITYVYNEVIRII